jgi:hypothetical protein
VTLPLAVSDTAAISIAGILVSGVVGPGFAARWARSRQRADHRQAHEEKEHEDLTSLLDGAAVALAPGVSKFRKARSGGEPELDVWSGEVHATYERLLLRLAEDDPVAVAYKAARDRLTAVAEVFAEGAGATREDAAAEAFEAARTDFLARARECLSTKAAGS